MDHPMQSAMSARKLNCSVEQEASHYNSIWMDGPTPCANVVSGDIGCETYVYSLSCEKSHVEHKKCACCNMRETAKITHQEALYISSVHEEDHYVVREAAFAPSAFPHVPNVEGGLSGPNATSDQDKALDSKEIKTCQESCHSASFDANKHKSLSKCATFPCSLEIPLVTLSIKENNKESSIQVQGLCCSTIERPAYARLMSLPSSLKLVSAMKGGRAQSGISPTTKPYVKWAPEVYDPPATSMMHTVKKSHQQRPKAKKKKHKNKHKGKSSRGSGTERKHANRGSTSNASEPLDWRLPAAGERFLLDGYGKTNTEVLEYAVSTSESKCRSSFLREAIAEVHLSTAEAS